MKKAATVKNIIEKLNDQGDKQSESTQGNLSTKTKNNRRRRLTKKHTIHAGELGETTLFGALQTDRDDVKSKFKSPTYQIFDKKATYEKLNTVF